MTKTKYITHKIHHTKHISISSQITINSDFKCIGIAMSAMSSAVAARAVLIASICVNNS